MITVCTKVELKFELEVEHKKAEKNELNLLDWKKAIFFLKNKRINEFF